MKDFIKAILLLLFSAFILIYDQYNYVANKQQTEKQKMLDRKQIQQADAVSDIQIQFSPIIQDSMNEFLLNHDYWQANKESRKLKESF